MRIFQNLFERRSHPEINIKLSAWEELKQYKDDPNIFISFTKIEKLGINPQSIYNTPAGIYFYPLKASWKFYEIDAKSDVPLKEIFPFAANNRYIHIVRVKDMSKCLIVSKYTESNYTRDIKLLYKYFIEDSVKNKASKIGSHYNGNKSESPANRLMDQLYSFYYSIIEKSFPNIKQQIYSKQSLFYTFCLRKILGYTGIIDDIGEGVIHENEPLQAVLFDPKIYVVVKTILNTSPKKYSSVEGQLIKFISQVIIDLEKIITIKSEFKYHSKYDDQIKKYANARITDRVIDSITKRFSKSNIKVLKEFEPYTHEIEGRTLSDFALGWILPIIFKYSDNKGRSIANAISFLNEFFKICSIHKCELVNKGMFKYNILHLAAKYKQINVLKLAITYPTIFGTPILDQNLFLETNYDRDTPYQVLYQENKKEAEDFLSFLQAMRPKIFQQHPEAFSIRNTILNT
jgi:hypothetical protein